MASQARARIKTRVCGANLEMSRRMCSFSAPTTLLSSTAPCQMACSLSHTSATVAGETPLAPALASDCSVVVFMIGANIKNVVVCSYGGSSNVVMIWCVQSMRYVMWYVMCNA